MKTELFFEGGGHKAKIKILSGKQALVATENTGFKYVAIKALFNADKLKDYFYYTKFMSKEGFVEYVISEFKIMGYELKKINKEG